MFGKLLSLPVRILNIPARVIEKTVDSMCGDETPKEDRVFSAPLDAVAGAIEEAVDGE